MDPVSLVIGAMFAVALGLIGYALRARWMPAAKAAEAKAEDDVLAAGMAILAKLTDKSSEQHAIASAQASMAHKDAMLAAMAAHLAKPAGTPLPTIQP